MAPTLDGLLRGYVTVHSTTLGGMNLGGMTLGRMTFGEKIPAKIGLGGTIQYHATLGIW